MLTLRVQMCFDLVRMLFAILRMFFYTICLAGADLVGELQFSGIGELLEAQEGKSPRLLAERKHESNHELWHSVKEDVHSEWLLLNAQQAAKLGRMSAPEVWAEGEQLDMLVQPRFVVEQTKEDGSRKLRSIDHFSWSADRQGKAGSVNGHVSPAEKMRHHTLENLADSMREFHALIQEPPGLIKADVDSAFRRIPVSPKSRWACGVAWKAKGKVRTHIFFVS